MKKQKKRELEVGQIWQVPKTLEVRTITGLFPAYHAEDRASVQYHDIAVIKDSVYESAFRFWITRKKAKLIGHYNFKTKKAVPTK